MVATPSSTMSTNSNENNGSSITINSNGVIASSNIMADNKSFYFLQQGQQNLNDTSTLQSSVIPSSLIQSTIPISNNSEIDDAPKMPEMVTNNAHVGPEQAQQDQEIEQETELQQQLQTRFCFYNAEDFVVNPKSATPSPKKSPKIIIPKISSPREHQGNLVSDDISEPEMASEKPNTKLRFNFYDAHEVKVTQTILTTVTAQEIDSDATATTAEDILYLSKQNSGDGSSGSHENNSDSAGDTVNESILDSIEILKSLQEHEQQRLEILGTNQSIGKASIRSKKHTKGVLANSTHTDNVDNNNSTIALASSSTKMSHDGNVTQLNSNSGKQEISKAPVSSDRQQLGLQNVTTSEGLTSTNFASNDSNRSQNTVGCVPIESNPYEDAIKEALLLIRRHRKGPDDTVLGSVAKISKSSSMSPQNNEQLFQRSSNAPFPQSQLLDRKQMTNINNDLEYSTLERNQQPGHHSSSNASFGQSNQALSGNLPKKIQLSVNTNEKLLFHGDGDAGNSPWSNPSDTPGSDQGLGLVGDSYQMEIESRRRQRQERMAKYANRLAELKQEDHISPSRIGAQISKSNEPVVPVVPTAAAGLTFGGHMGVTDQSTPSAIPQNDSTSMKSPTISIDTADIHSWHDDESTNFNKHDGRNNNNLAIGNDDHVLAARSPMLMEDEELLSHGFYENYLPSSYQTEFKQTTTTPNLPSDISLRSTSFTSHEQEIQFGVERVLLAILERANGNIHSRGRGQKVNRENDSVLELDTSKYLLPSHTNFMTVEEKKSSNPSDDSNTVEGYNPNLQHLPIPVSTENSTARYLQQNFPAKPDALAKALSDLLNPTTLPSQSLCQSPLDIKTKNMSSSGVDNFNSKAMSPNFSRYGEFLLNQQSPGDDKGSSQDDADDVALLHPNAMRSEDDSHFPYQTAHVVGGHTSAGNECITVASLTTHIDHDPIVEKDSSCQDESCTSSKSTGSLEESSHGVEPSNNNDRYQVSSGDDDEVDREYIPLGTDTTGSRDNISKVEGTFCDVASTSTKKCDTNQNLEALLSREDAITTADLPFEDGDDGCSTVSVPSYLPSNCEEASHIESSVPEGCHRMLGVPDYGAKKDFSSSLGPRNRRSGGTTGVVLDDDSSSSSQSESSSSSMYSGDSSKSGGDDDDEDENSSSRHGKPSDRGASSPTLFESLSAAVSLVTGVTSREENIVGASSLVVDKAQSSPSAHSKRNKYNLSDDEEALLESDEGSDSEAFDLMLALCAHLLPVGVDTVRRRKPRCKRILEPFPNWDDSNPDEPGYRIVRLNSHQLRRVQHSFNKLVDCLPNSQKNVVKKTNLSKNASDESAFQQDLKEAEDLLDEEERRARGFEKSSGVTVDRGDDSLMPKSVNKSNKISAGKGDTSSSSSNTTDNDDASVYDECEQLSVQESCLKDFHGVKPVGKGEMGELEFFSLPIVFKSHVTGFEPTKDLVLEPGNVVAGQYLVEGVLGSAAFSTAYKCLNLNADTVADQERHVCLKVIKNTKDFFDQSLDEIKILELLRQTGKCHEMNLIEMKSFFYHREHLIIVTELLRQNLFEFGKFIVESGEEPYFTIPRLSYIARQCLIGLNFVHKLSLVHSDVKPENILLASYSRALVKVIDFGSSCWLTDRQSSYIQSRSYRAPEVVLGLPYDGRIDVWSLGCVVAEMYTGEVTFQNDSIVSMLSRIEAICGPFPRHMIANGRQSSRYFTKCGLLYERVSSEGDDSKQEDSYSDDDVNDSDEENEHSKIRYIDLFQPKKTTLSRRLGFDVNEINTTKSGTSDSLDKIFMKTADKQETYLSRGSMHKTSEHNAGVRSEELSHMFVDFVRQMLTIDPEIRPSAEQALRHPLMLFASTLCEDDVKYPSHA